MRKFDKFIQVVDVFARLRRAGGGGWGQKVLVLPKQNKLFLPPNPLVQPLAAAPRVSTTFGIWMSLSKIHHFINRLV